MGQHEALAGTGDTYVGQATLLLEFVRVAEGPDVGKHTVLHAHDAHHRELQTLGGVHGHKHNLP